MSHFPRRPAVTFLAGACLLALGACSREAAAPANEVTESDVGADNIVTAGNDVAEAAQAFKFADATGKTLGSVSVNKGADGLTLMINASGMPAGSHGIHLHEKGLCEGPKFESAGKHWNPAAKQHGRDNPAGAHLGDLANFEVDASGAGTASFTVAGAAVATGATPLADADGTALIVHAKADDYKTDPSGDSGDRIACAVLAAPN